LLLELEDKEPMYLQARGTIRTNAKATHLTKVFAVFISSPPTNESFAYLNPVDKFSFN
jgi:hypothetical protein